MYKKLPGGKDVVQVAKDALNIINSVLMVGASARLRAEHNMYDHTVNHEVAQQLYGHPTSVNSRVAVDRNRTARAMVQIGGGAI